MVVSTLRGRGNGNDVLFSYGDTPTPVGFKLAVDQNGIMQYMPGIVQQTVSRRYSGAFGYDALPPEINSPFIYESWALGAGFVLSEPIIKDAAAGGILRYEGYSYSRGIDASEEDRLYLSPERQTAAGTATTDAPSKYLVTGQWGPMRSSGAKLYLWSTDHWALMETFSTTITDFIEYGNGTDNYLVVALGDSTNSEYSTDLSTWSTADAGVTYLTVRGVSSALPVLWGSTIAGTLSTTVNLANWSAGDQIASAGDNATALATVSSQVVLFTETAAYLYDGSTRKTLIEDSAFRDSTNGKLHLNRFGQLFFNFLGRLVQYDAASDAFVTVFKPQHPELNGTITALTGTATHVWFALKNADGNTYIIKQLIDGSANPYHTIAYLGAKDCNAMVAIASGSLHATNPVMAFGYGSADRYFILARHGMRPEDDSNYRFDANGTTGGVLYAVRADGGMRTFSKFINGSRIFLENATASQNVTVDYSLDDESGGWVQALTASVPGVTTANFNVGVKCLSLTHRVTMNTGTNTDSPRVFGVYFSTTPHPPRSRMWTMMLEINPQQSAGVSQSASTKEEFLLNMVDQQVTFTDYHGVEHYVIVQDMQSQGYHGLSNGERRDFTAVYQIILTEVASN